MVVAWEGGDPPDKSSWIAVARAGLNEGETSYWLRFYRHPQGWRFELDRREADEAAFDRAEEGVALHLYTLLLEKGLPLDPEWRPGAPGPPPSIASLPDALASPAAASPSPDYDAHVHRDVPSVGRGYRRGKNKKKRREARRREAESAGETREDGGAPAPAPDIEPVPVSPPDASAGPVGRRRLARLVLVYLPALVLLAFAAWLARDRFLSRPSSPATPSPSATQREDSFAERRLKELEAVVAQLRQERAQAPARPAPPARTAVGAARPVAAQPSPTPVTAPTAPVPTAVLSPEFLSDDTSGASAAIPLGVSEPLSTPPPPPQAGDLADVNDPGVTAPAAVTRTVPRYPPLARERRLSGTVRLRALVDETGAVVDVAVVQASPPRLGFEEAAVAHARTRVYKPATKEGVPVRVWLPIVVEFRFPDR
jgi:protein TonB